MHIRPSSKRQNLGGIWGDVPGPDSPRGPAATKVAGDKFHIDKEIRSRQIAIQCAARDFSVFATGMSHFTVMGLGVMGMPLLPAAMPLYAAAGIVFGGVTLSVACSTKVKEIADKANRRRGEARVTSRATAEALSTPLPRFPGPETASRDLVAWLRRKNLIRGDKIKRFNPPLNFGYFEEILRIRAEPEFKWMTRDDLTRLVKALVASPPMEERLRLTDPDITIRIRDLFQKQYIKVP
jgi:hypothetical protein